VVIAGADNALPGVVAGMVDAPVIAVPVSTGSTNNNSLQGLGNLVSAVSSCVPGVAVVNLDGAAAAAVMAAKVLRTAAVRVEKLMAAQSVAAASAPAPAASAPAPTAVPSFVLPSDITVNNVVPAYEGLALPAVQPAAV
jgi:phosphoribosylcarboxyaminoimidazole (NCAIR) mutase